MPCPCQNTWGTMPVTCADVMKCIAIAIKEGLVEKPAPDTEALFKKFIDEFPVLSALDVFCSPCGRPRAISYREDPDGSPSLFYAVFSCNCAEAFGIGYRSGRPPMTRKEVMKLIRGVNSRE